MMDAMYCEQLCFSKLFKFIASYRKACDFQGSTGGLFVRPKSS